jgi:SprT protein
MTMNSEKAYLILKNHLPEPSLAYCFSLWQSSPFDLKITKTRQTKIGDFTSARSKRPRITLNHDLNPYQFLITYIHEVAHLYVYLKHGNRVDPHGEEWKKMFQQLMEPMLWETFFPEEILHVLRLHMVNPKASSYGDSDLTKAIRAFDKNADKLIVLSDLPVGSLFEFHGRFFKKGEIKRTRILCREIKSKRNYLVPADVLVNNVQLSFL